MNEFDYQKRQLELGRVSRRQFIHRTAALGASAALIGTALSRPAWANEPVTGGTLTFGMGGGSTTDSMNPSTATDSVAISQVHTTYNHLVELNSNREAIPELAVSWEPSSDAVTWAFKLRKDVEFHNGKTMDAQDVVYSIQRHMGPDAQTAASGVVAGIEEVRADGPDTVIITLKGGNADLPYLMADYHLAIVPDGFDDWANAVGTGPYMLEHYEAGVESKHVRNPNYWKEGRAHADAVEYTVINDATARSAALTSGQVSVINRISKRTVDLMKRNQALEVLNSPAAQHYTLPMHTQEGPLTDPNLRLALKHAIDREALVNTLLSGYGRAGNDHPIPDFDQYFDSSMAQRAYDPDRAKHYLREAGVEDFTIQLHTSEAAFPEAVDTAQMYQEAARAAGINLELVRAPADGYWSDIWLNVPLCMSYWGGRATPDMMYSIAYTCGASWNETHYCSEDFDQLIREARAELDQARRKELYAQAQALVHMEGGNIIPMFADYVDGYRRDEVGGYEEDFVFEMVGHRGAERLWAL